MHIQLFFRQTWSTVLYCFTHCFFLELLAIIPYSSPYDLVLIHIKPQHSIPFNGLTLVYLNHNLLLTYSTNECKNTTMFGNIALEFLLPSLWPMILLLSLHCCEPISPAPHLTAQSASPLPSRYPSSPCSVPCAHPSPVLEQKKKNLSDLAGSTTCLPHKFRPVIRISVVSMDFGSNT